MSWRKGHFLLPLKKARLLRDQQPELPREASGGGSFCPRTRPLVTCNWGVCKIETLKGGASLDEDAKLGGVQPLHRNWLSLSHSPPWAS